jgi:hypothetical protein
LRVLTASRSCAVDGHNEVEIALLLLLSPFEQKKGLKVCLLFDDDWVSFVQLLKAFEEGEIVSWIREMRIYRSKCVWSGLVFDSDSVKVFNHK